MRNLHPGRGDITVSRKAEEKGLTLIELTIILLILGILYSFAMPKVRILTEINLTSSARRLAETIKVAQSNAITHASQYLMRIDIEKGRYTYQQGTEIGLGRWQFVVRDNDKPDERTTGFPKEHAFNLPKGVFFQDVYDLVKGEKYDKGEIRTEFSPRGITRPLLIHLGDNKSRFYTILVDRYGGRVTLQKGNLSYSDLFPERSK